MNKKHIVIIGLGGVGGYFGFKISQRNEADGQYQISFIARGKTYEKIKRDGLILLSPEHPNSVTRPDAVYQNISEIVNPNLIFICVKEYDLANVCHQLTKVITRDTVLLPVMNGADIYDRIRKIIPENIILRSCVYVASHIKEKGVVEHKGRAGKLIFGRDPEHVSTDLTWVINLMEHSGIEFECKDNAQMDIWTKFIFIASFGLVTAKHNSSVGTVCNDELQKNEAAGIMEEIKLIANEKNIHLPANIIDKTFKQASTFPPETHTSLQIDVNSDKEDSELELFAGSIIGYSTKLNIETPCTQKIYWEIKAAMHHNL